MHPDDWWIMSVAVIQRGRGNEENNPMKHLVVLGILVAITFTTVRNKISHGPYDYDEADYMSAASLGLERNWVDAGSMPLTDFVAAGRRSGADANQRAGLSALARSGSDPVVYRHWHGPLYYFWLTIPSSIKANEHTTRELSLVFPVVTVLVIYCGSLLILGGIEGQVAAILASALFLWSPVTLETTELAPHMLFVLWYVCGLMLLAKAAAGGGRRYYYAAVVCAGLAAATLEVAFVLILVLAIFAWWQRRQLGADLVLARNSIGVLLATVLVSWPTGLLKLNFVKAYMVMVYLAVFRKGAWGDVTFLQTWSRRIAVSPVEWFLFAAALVLLIATGKRQDRRYGMVFLLFAGLMILATLRVYAEGTRYMTPFFAAVEIFTAWTLAPMLVRFARPALVYGALGVICFSLIWNSERQLSGFRLNENPAAFAVIDAIRARGLAEKTLLIPRMDIPTLHYYFPGMQTQAYTDPGEISIDRRDRHFDAVLYSDGSLDTGESGAGR